MPRPQLTLRTLPVAMLLVAAFYAGATWQRAREVRQRESALQAYRDYAATGGCMKGADEEVRDMELAIEHLAR
jgi:hypothetical protein